MMTPQKQQYIEIAEKYTEQELSEILHVNPRTIRRYAQELGIKPKPTKYTNASLSEWRQRFESIFANRIELKDDMNRDKCGRIHATCKCLKCQTEWSADIGVKIRTKTGCISCDKGNHGNKYDINEIESMMNRMYADQWKLIKCGHYSQKDSIIRCTLCGNEQLVNLSNFIHTTTERCTRCQTGSFGEYAISNILLYNNIPFEREKIIKIRNHKYRLDFLIDNKIAIEYSGLQHFEHGLYYNEEINNGVLKKQKWCKAHDYAFIELLASYDLSQIINDLSSALQISLKTPTPEFFKRNNPDMQTVLSYMKTHSARQTMKDLNIPVTKIKKYVFLSGYQSISAWQADNKIDI